MEKNMAKSILLNEALPLSEQTPASRPGSPREPRMRRVIKYSFVIFLTYFCFYALLTVDFRNLDYPSLIISLLSTVQSSLLEEQPFANSMKDLWIFGIFVLVLGTAEYYWPADKSDQPESTGSDLPYVFLEKIGAYWFLMTLTSHPLLDKLQTSLSQVGVPFLNLDHTLKSLGVPFVVSALIQLFIFDGFDTLRHRIEHYFGGLWAFHSVHHSQVKMTLLTFERNHFVSLLFNSIVYTSLVRFLGIHIDVLASVYITYNFIEYLTHANVNLSYGKILDKIIVCPRYHRAHHARIEFAGPPYGVNFANVFPVWDILLGTSDFSYKTTQTGIYSESEKELGTNFLENHISGFRKFFKSVNVLPRWSTPKRLVKY